MEMHLGYWKLPVELGLALDIALRKKVTIPENVDWRSFDDAVRQHRIQPLLIRGLRSMDVARYPELERYRSLQNKYTMESLNRLQALAQIGGAFADAGIRMLAMKGPLLAIELYGDPSLRTSRDLDLMVEESALARAGEVLQQLGYHPEGGPFRQTPLRKKYLNLIELEKHEIYQKGDICVEVHWKSNFQAEQSFDALWAQREERMIMGKPIAVMGEDERYSALIIHAAEHGFLRLRWLLDLYELQKKPQFSWEKTYRQMCERGVGELLLETLLVMYRLDLPGLKDVHWDCVSLTREAEGVCLRVEDRLEQDARKAGSLCDAVYPLLLREVQRGDQEWTDYDTQLPTSINQKTFLQKILIVCGPSSYDFELIDLPDGLFWLYFIIRPFHWLWRKLTGRDSN